MSNSAFSFELCEEHAVDASFLWLLRDQAVVSPNYNLHELAELDERVEAHLDGLRLAGEVGWQVAESNLSWQEAGEVFTGTAIAFAMGRKKLIDQVMEIGAQSMKTMRGAISGIAWINDRDTVMWNSPFAPVHFRTNFLILFPVERIIRLYYFYQDIFLSV